MSEFRLPIWGILCAKSWKNMTGRSGLDLRCCGSTAGFTLCIGQICRDCITAFPIRKSSGNWPITIIIPARYGIREEIMRSCSGKFGRIFPENDFWSSSAKKYWLRFPDKFISFCAKLWYTFTINLFFSGGIVWATERCMNHG